MSIGTSPIRQRRALGQVFLKTDEPCIRLVNIVRQHSTQAAIEIGPGGGILTKVLLGAGITVTAVEKDERFAARLVDACSPQMANSRQLDVRRDDILRVDLERWIAQQTGAAAVCGNIPYNISSSVIQWVIPSLNKLSCAVFMVQKEFAERVTASPSTKDYGSLSVYAQLRAKIAINFEVPRALFTPVPKVDSAVFTMVKPDFEYSPADLSNTETLTRIAFSQRRKMMRNSISQLLSPELEQSLDFDLNRRPDSISPLEYLELARKLFV